VSLRRSVDALFAPARHPGRVGAEIELIAVTDEPRPRPVHPATLASLFEPGLPVCFEPGGQLELSLPPEPGPSALVASAQRTIGRVSEIATAQGIRLESTGTNAYHSCRDVPLFIETARYQHMQRILDRNGLDGRRMMRLTASLQISIDLLPGRAGAEQWLVANLAGPALTAAFANSPTLDGRPAGVPGARTLIWQGIDPSRTGYDGRHLDPGDPIGAYHAFAAGAERLPIPEAEDPAYHLSTLFPPVRPRGGYLEVRYLDTQPLPRVAEAIHTMASLLYDSRVRREALELLLPQLNDLSGAWHDAASGRSSYMDNLLALTRVGQRS